MFRAEREAMKALPSNVLKAFAAATGFREKFVTDRAAGDIRRGSYRMRLTCLWGLFLTTTRWPLPRIDPRRLAWR